jgi:anti-sigma factor RsiW
MRHPGPLLTDYVDGSLGPDARAEVEAHLQGCATCRDEVGLARAGKRTADALPQPQVPAGLAEAAIAEARRVTAERSPEVKSISSAARRRPDAQRWLALAAAAAVIAAVALVGPKLGQAPKTIAAEGAGAGAEGPTYPQATTVEIQHANYTLGELSGAAQELRAGFRSAQDAAAGAAVAASPSTLTSEPPLEATTGDSPDRLGAATTCLDRAFDHPEGSLARVILADYQGERAYFGVYLIGPGAGLPPELLQLDVAAVHGCRLLGQSTARL